MVKGSSLLEILKKKNILLKSNFQGILNILSAALGDEVKHIHILLKFLSSLWQDQLNF